MGITDEGLDILQATVGLGKWQFIQLTLLLSFYLTWTQSTLGILILGFVPDFACKPPESIVNESTSSNVPLNQTFGQSCEWHNPTDNTSQACSGGFVYAEPKEASVASEWDLVCGHTYLVDLSQTILDVGFTVGTIIFTLIADRYGRRKVVIWGHAGFLAAALVNCLANSIIMFIIFRFVLGSLLAGTAMVGWVVTLELFRAKHRTMAALFANIVWGFCTGTVPALGYLMKGLNWRYVQLAVCAFSIIIVGQYIFIDEPLKWLVANGRMKEAVKILRKAGKMNGVNSERVSTAIKRYFPDNDDKDRVVTAIGAKSKVDTEKSEVGEYGKADVKSSSDISPMALIRHPKLRTIFLVMDLAWFTNSLIYIGLYMLSTTMSGNRYLNLFLSSLAEFAAGIVLLPFLLKCGRRKMMIALHLLAAVSLVSAAVLHVTTEGSLQYIAVTCAVMLGKFCNGGTYSLIFMYTPEVYPTNIRSSGVGLTSLFARLGGFLSPFTATVARAVPWVPAGIFGGFCFLVALASPLLPDTRGKPLPQTLEDLEKLYSTEQNKEEIETQTISKFYPRDV